MREQWMETLREFFFAQTIDAREVDQIVRFKHRYIPKRLFKYREVSEYSLSNLSNDTLWCARADSFNDPYDCALSVELSPLCELAVTSARKLGFFTLDEIGSIEQAEDPMQKLLELSASKNTGVPAEQFYALRDKVEEARATAKFGILDKMNNGLRNAYKICSLCQRIDSLLMWSHYTRNHQGFAMEYDFTRLPQQSPVARLLWPVIYDEKIYDASHVFVRKSPDDPVNNLFAVGAAIHKGLDWQYEQEWRIVVPDGENEPPQNIPVPKPIAVYLGAAIEPETAEKVIGIADSKGIPVFKMQLSRSEFKMVPISI